VRLDPVPEILYEDNHLLIANKRPGDIIQGDKTGDKPLSEIIKDFIKVRDNKPGNVFLGVSHRLDRPVSGAVIFPKTSKALARINEMLQKHEIKKVYWAVTQNKPPEDSGVLVHYLLRNQQKNKSKAFLREVKSGLKAELNYSLIASSDRYYLLEIGLKTGRHHQIRAQLSAINCPIKGDLKYGSPRPNPGGFIHLHARYLGFVHPVKDEYMEVIAEPVKSDPLWNYFSGLFPGRVGK
jgi:23S rRNA pseudouridine1911/1915/1917 synthase